MARSRTPLVKPLAPPTKDWSKRVVIVDRVKKPQEVHPAPNAKATNKYLEMMFRGWGE